MIPGLESLETEKEEGLPVRLLTKDEVKKYTGKLLDKEKECEIVDFLRENFRRENAEVFEKEETELANRKENKTNISLFTFNKLRSKMTAKLNIRSDCFVVKDIKVIIFFEFILRRFRNENESKKEEYERKDKKIVESKYVYSFYRGLVASGKCKPSSFKKAIRILKLENALEQGCFDNDEFYGEHDFYRNYILDKYLIPFMEEYRNYW